MNQTPNSDRLHIALLGRCNAGKSSLINALTGQDVAIVSPLSGTTTDPVNKPMEIHPLGACLLTDTPGFDDEGEIGSMRVQRTLQAVERANVALLLCSPEGMTDKEHEWFLRLKEQNIPCVVVLNKADTLTDPQQAAERIASRCRQMPVIVSAVQRTGIDTLIQAIVRVVPPDFGARTLTGSLVSEGDLVLLVMPQDIQAPKGRLILPQVQVMRELLDKRCLVMSCTTEGMDAALRSLTRAPKLIITDSQVFPAVHAHRQAESLLTSFSILYAAYKGDIDYFTEGAQAIDRLTEHSRVLIAEACTHAPLSEDIGRVKLPRLLRKRIGEGLQIDIVSGNDFPEDLSCYDLVIHCGGCMFNRRYVLSRIGSARMQHVPMTNYGVAIAYLSGILEKVVF